MPRLVRKAPLSERITAYVDPMDWLMWVSEELNSGDWEEFAKSYATSLGLGMNVLFVIAKANAGKGSSDKEDDVFGDYQRSGGWLKWFMNLVVLGLTTLSFLNAFFTFYRKRHYRLFEQPIETNPSTPSAQRVRVDSSPMANSPLRFITSLISSESAESRAHPDGARDVWEIALWDPNPLCVQICCLFSPVHVFLYYANLPVAPLDPQPSVKVVMTIITAFLFSLFMVGFKNSYDRYIKDDAIIKRQVMSEYDTKFVHPLVQRPSRDVGVQVISTSKKGRTRDSAVGVGGVSDDLASEVVTYTPTTVINRGFQTNPNVAYASQYDPHNLASQNESRLVRSTTTPSLRPYQNAQYSTASTATAADFSSPIRPSNTPNPFRPALRPSNVGSGDGGSLGVYSHAASPLRKSASTNFISSSSRSRDSLGGGGDRRREPSPLKREGSPLKRMSTPGGFAPDSGVGTERGFAAVPADEGAFSKKNPFQKRYSGMGVGRRESGRF
ncbi:hypothetical protein BDV96DRAFT_582502 [Lophiotrema nucula]|uniref:Nuclear rim protein 1 n=1 Tax=Lophiotrema nucula TaxID=690887 RepID=A0A6A5YYA0_9PLEO|nr:hypothetical protein BDV96DRAFT_582502 [Lophiotrema nucula]